MELEGLPDERLHCIFAFTDWEPTREERTRRNKKPLTLKQKAVFRAITKHIAEHRSGSTKSKLMGAMGQWGNGASEPDDHEWLSGDLDKKELDSPSGWRAPD